MDTAHPVGVCAKGYNIWFIPLEVGKLSGKRRTDTIYVQLYDSVILVLKLYIQPKIWLNMLSCIGWVSVSVVDLAKGGSATKGATLSSF